MDKQWLDRGPCPNCGSSDGNVQHKEGYSHCFVCGTHFNSKGNKMEAEKVKLFLTSRIPMGKLGTGEDVSNTVAFLSSDSASYITGETIHVNGGMYMG